MKRFLILFGVLLFSNGCAFATGDIILKDVGIAKYAVIEAKRDYAPIRFEPNQNAKRFTHLKKGVVVYADKESDDFYRIDMGLGEPFWIEKKYADVQAIIPDKRIQEIKNIKFSQDKKKYEIFIPMDIHNSYSFEEKADGLGFNLYDVKYIDADIKNKPGSFNIYKKKDSVLAFDYITPALFGYDVKTDKNGLVVQIRKPPEINRKKPLNGIKIMVDPGHGGEETGVCAFGYEEKDVNLKMSKQIKKALEKKGAKVYLTRKRDKYVPLYERLDMAVDKNADILISVHQNSLANPDDVAKKHGVGVYYYNKQALPLANSVRDSLVKQSGFRDDGVNYASFALTRPTNPVSLLVECGYLINKDEMEKLTDKKFQKEFSRALATGVEDYLRYLIVF